MWTVPATGAHRGTYPGSLRSTAPGRCCPVWSVLPARDGASLGGDPFLLLTLPRRERFNAAAPSATGQTGKRGPCLDRTRPPATGPPGAVRRVSLGAELVSAVAVHHIRFPKHDLLHLTSVPPGFPGGPGVGTLPVNAGGVGSACDPGRPHMPRGS